MKTSNTISLILFLLLAAVVGYFYYHISNLNKEIEFVNEEFGKVEMELRTFEGLRPDTLIISYMRDRISFIENWIFHNGKFFLVEDNSMITWPYLQNIINRFNQNFQFDFAVVTSGAEQYSYTVSGSSSIHDIYAFISHIERLGALYTIETLTFSQVFRESDTGPENIVNYNISIRPWIDTAIGKSLGEQPFRRIQYSPLLRDPMRPSIHPPMWNPSQEQFIAYEDLQFVSFSSGQAYFILDNTIVTLRPMQRVAYGYFSHVEESNSRAVFRINRTGLYETVYQELR